MSIAKKIDIITVISSVLLLIMIFLIFAPVGEAEELYGGVMRLHILAESDDKDDQKVKLEVRDRHLVTAKEIFSDCANLKDAASAYEENYDTICDTVREALDGAGRENTDFKVSLAREYFDTRDYGAFALPSGKYISLTVRLGEAKGKNWWCVLFPPICLEAADARDDLSSSGLNDATVNDLTSAKNGFRFRIVEFFGEVASFFDNLG